MKALNQFKYILLVCLLMLGFNAMAQPDLSVIANGDPYQFNGDGQPNSVQLQINNNGDMDTVNGVTLTFTYDMFVDPSFAFLDPVISSEWDCPNFSVNLSCSYIGNITQSSASFLNLDVIVQPGSFDFAPAFSVFVTDVNGDEIITTDNLTFVNVEYVAGGGTDFSLQATPPGDPVEFNADGGNYQMNYTVANDISGLDEGDQTTVTFNYATELSNTSVTSSDPSWSCGPGTQQWICNYGGNFAAGFSSALTFNFNAPIAPVLVNNAIGVDVFNALGDPNLSNNFVTTNIDFVAAGGPSADLDLTMFANSSFYNVGDIIVLDLTLHNPFASTGAPLNTTVTTTLPTESVFNSAQVTNVAGWLCTHDGSITGGDVTCDSQGNPLAIGSNVFIEVTAVASSAATTAFADALVMSDFDPMPSNDFASISFTINLADADLSITFNSTSGVYNQGDTISYDIQVTNPMISSASPSDVNVTIDLPVEVAISNIDLSSAPGWSCVHDGAMTGGQINCDRGGLPFISNSVHIFTVDVTADSPATNATVQASVSSIADTFTSNNISNQSDVINGLVTDFSIVKTVSATDFAINDTFTYFLTVANDVASTGAPVDVVINDQLPTEVSYDSYVVGSNMGTSVNCVHDGSSFGGLFSCNTGGTPFAVGEIVTIDINVTAASASATVNNTATVATSTDPNGIGLNNISAAPTVVINGPLLTTIAATKTANLAGVPVTTVSYGQQFEYILQVDNTGVNDAINVHVTDSLPADVSFVSFDAIDWTCIPIGLPIRSTNGVGETVDCTMNAPLTPGSNSQITVNVVATTNTAVGVINNQMEAIGDNTGPLVISNNSVNLLNAMADLTLNQTPSPVDLNSAVDFDLVFSNTGTSPLTGVQIDSVLPQDFIFNGFTAGQGFNCTLNAGTVNCIYFNPIPINSAVTLTLNLSTPTSLVTNQNYDLVVSAKATELAVPISRTLAVDFFTSEFTVFMNSDLSAVTEGQSFVHTLNIRNSGNLDLLNVEAIFAFPSYGQLMGVQSNEMNCSVNSYIVQCVNLSALQPNDINKVDLTFQVNGFNGLFGTSATIQGDGTNKAASASTQINAASDLSNDLSLVKSASVSQIGQQGAFSYVFDVTNVGSEDQTDFNLTDDLPSGVIFQAANGLNWTCTGNSMISCQFNGVLSTNEQTQLIMDVIAPSQIGLITNTANISTTDENPSNNQSSVNVQVTTGTGGNAAVADLAVQISANSANIINTEQVTWVIDVTNLGPDAAENVHIENQFPIGFVADEVLVNGGVTCVMLSTSLACDVASMSVNQAVQINLIGGFNNGFEGQLMNVVDVSSDAIDPDLSNNQSQAQVNVTLVEDLSVDLALELMTEPQSIRQGDVFELKFKTKNFGPDLAVEPTVSATLSGLISQVQIVNSGQWACQASSTTLSCHYPGSYLVGMEQMIVLNVATDRIEQTSQPIMFNAVIESSAIDVNPANNLIGLSNEVSRTPNADEIFNAFSEAIGPGASETVMRTIRNVSSYCARRYFMAIEGLCEEMIAGARPENRADIINLMEEITPNEVTGQSTSAKEMVASQFSNIGSRLSELRGGGGSGFSVSGLNGRYGNESIPIGMLAYLNQSEDEQQAVSNINDFISPWGFFVNGSISMGERDATGRELGFDFDTYGLTAGVDYRFSPTKVAGVALGYANFDSTIEDEAEMKSTGFTLTGYGSFYIKDNFYVDTRISYGNPDFEQKRRINFELDNIAIDRIASGKTDASQYSVAMSMGYHFNKNSWNITPNASVQYVRTSIDSFQETGAGGFNFLFNDQEIKSMVWSVGASVSRAISLKNGVISPQFDFNFNRETEDDGGLIEARFLTAPVDEIFYIETDEPDRTYGSAGIGLVFIGANGKQAYINYRSIFGLEGFTRGTINIGARFEF